MSAPDPAARWRWGLWAAVIVAALLVPLSAAIALLAGAGVLRLGLAVRRRWRRRRAVGARDGGVVLGRDRAGRPVRCADEQLAAHALIVGASGSGKSTTLLAILADHVRRGRPVVAIDMKGSPGFAAELGRAAAAAGRELRVWTPDGPSFWNPLAHGNPTALKDKLISTERFSEPHYQRAAERYLQLAFTVLAAVEPNRSTDLSELVAVMEPPRLARALRRAPPELALRVGDYLQSLTPDQQSAVRGLGTRLALVSESSAGPYLGRGPADRTVDLAEALRGGDVVLMSVNSSVYGKLGAQLGALAIQDLTAAAGYRLGGPGRPPPATVAIDEFSALGADNVLALLARGREAGVAVLVATQELTDLERAGPGFRDQVLGIVGTKLAHRQDVHGSAVMFAQLAGTERVWEVTRTIRPAFARRGQSLGTRRQVDRLIVHPTEIQTLAPGEAVVVVKTPRSQAERVRVAPPATWSGSVRSTATVVRGERAQPAPGVTR
ncbi:MAG: type IV secretion system DNA-binding domain-containing protein [Solirubrobacterales bacterium]|nr:type IV secretion system DNA-binding domain-containing protein [Solirubrobacterales bacterium]